VTPLSTMEWSTFSKLFPTMTHYSNSHIYFLTNSNIALFAYKISKLLININQVSKSAH